MKIKKFVVNFTNASLKVTFCIICYIITLLFAICSGYFTVIFYSSSQSATNQLIIGLLAGLFELIKFIFAIAHPFMAYRNLEIENRVRRILNVALFMSILSSLYFFLESGDILRSPASKITSLVYSYVPMLNILPLKFSQFVTTMSLSIIIEVLIIKIPSIAPIFYFEKDYNRKRAIITNWDKLRDVFISIPNRFIDQLYAKYVYEPEGKKIFANDHEKVIKIQDYPKQKKYLATKKSLLITTTSASSALPEDDDDLANESDADELIKNEAEDFDQTKDTDLFIFLKTMYENSNDNISISQVQLSNLTGFSKPKINSFKNYLKQLDIIKTDTFKTYILVDYETAVKKIKKEGIPNEC